MGGDFTTNLKKSSNIAVIANTEYGAESLCASVALSEMIYKFLEKESDYLVSIYYLDTLPIGINNLAKKIKIYNKIGEKTLYVSFKANGVEKITYNLVEETNNFEIGLVGYTGKKNVKDILNTRVEEENIEMVVGVGFDSEEDLEKKVKYTKKISKKFVFNKKNLNGDTLVDGALDLFLREKVKPSKLASLAFSTYYSL